MPVGTLHTPLYERHVALNARLVPFAGWQMPLQYASGIIAEHQAVRGAWGIFDVSHMGRLVFQGADALTLLDYLVTSHVAGLNDNQARYGFMCLEDGGILDDVVVLRKAADMFLLVCNASNHGAVVAWAEQHATGRDVNIDDRTAETVMVAVQGPQARAEVDRVLGGTVPPLRRFHGAQVDSPLGSILVTRTGYTGEDGYELISSAPVGQRLWDALLAAGVTPCGLGARDTLRLEAGLPLHGQDIDRTTNPLEAGLERFVHLAGGDFVGKGAIESAAHKGVTRRLMGFKTVERGAVPRHDQPIQHAGSTIGRVTSGNFAPSLGVSVGLGYVPPEHSTPGQRLEVEARGKGIPVAVTSLPFYQRRAAKP